MKKYRYTQHGLGHLILDGKDVLMEKNDVLELPEDNEQVKYAVELGYLEEVKPEEPKVDKNPKKTARLKKAAEQTETQEPAADGEVK